MVFICDMIGEPWEGMQWIWAKHYIEFVDRFMTEVQKYDRLFGLIDRKIGTTSE